MLAPNGTLTHTIAFGHVWTTACRKCGAVQKIRVGDLTPEQARSAVATINGEPRECPGGYHVELSGWAMLWSLDLMLVKHAKAVARHELIPA